MFTKGCDDLSVTNRIDNFIKMKNISRMEFARLASVPYTTVMNLYNNGSSDARLSTLVKLSKILECSLDDLVDDYGTEVLVSSPDLVEVLRGNGEVKLDGRILTEKEKEKFLKLLKLIDEQ